MNKVRVAIVGCGYWGQNLIRNFAESADVEVTAVCDFNLPTLARTKRRYPTVELKQDFQQILSDSSIHAVVIATPASTHYPFAHQALRAGKHVLVEKPLATSTQQVLELMELAEKHDRTLMVDHTFIYTGAVRHMRSMIDAGEMVTFFTSTRSGSALGWYRATSTLFGTWPRMISPSWIICVCKTRLRSRRRERSISGVRLKTSLM